MAAPTPCHAFGAWLLANSFNGVLHRPVDLVSQIVIICFNEYRPQNIVRVAALILRAQGRYLREDVMLNLIDLTETLWDLNTRCPWLARVSCGDRQVVAEGRQREDLHLAGQALEATTNVSFVHLGQYASLRGLAGARFGR